MLIKITHISRAFKKQKLKVAGLARESLKLARQPPASWLERESLKPASQQPTSKPPANHQLATTSQAQASSLPERASRSADHY
jgi:hypothetical protein